MMWMRIAFFAYSLCVFDDKEPSDRWVPCPAGIQNGWGPAAERLRSDKILPPVAFTSEMQKWQKWGDENLRDGDLVHRLGDAHIARGLYPFSRNLAKLTGSKYSHSALVVFDPDGHAYIYDATKQSVRRQPFSVYMLDMIGPWCVQRPTGLDTLKSAAYIRDKWERQVPFDFDLSDSDDAFYCVELAVKACRAGGVDLGKSTPVWLLPEAYKWRVHLYFFNKCGLKLTSRVWYVGNKKNGILSSPKVKTIHEFDRKGTP